MAWISSGIEDRSRVRCRPTWLLATGRRGGGTELATNRRIPVSVSSAKTPSIRSPERI